MATKKHHVAVWLDHHEARLYQIAADSFDASVLTSPHRHLKRHIAKNASEANHPDDLKHFFHDIAQALESAEEVLIVGPSTAKMQFIKYVHGYVPKLASRIVGVETVDHPTDGQMVAFARKYFDRVDRMLGLTP